MEQELASIIKFVLDASDDPQPYYQEIPQDFYVPAVYFPVPEITTGGDTFNTYGAEYDWYVKFFHSTSQKAYSLALKALTAIKENRNLIPIIDKSGNKTGTGIRINDPVLRHLDDGAVQLTVRFVNRRPYRCCEAEKSQYFEIAGWKNPDVYVTREISTALETAAEQYLSDYPHPDKAGTVSMQ